MSDETIDPRETPQHPRRRTVLVGHGEAEARLLRRYRSGRMHHAWLVAGPRGIGKATLAYRLARFVLQYPDAASTAGRTSLHVPAEAPAARRIAAQGHSDLLVVQRNIQPKTKTLKGEIQVEDARAVSNFFSRTAGEGGWRVCIIDAADDLNRSSANAILKILEEPPSGALLILVSHRPGSLLATIRSRCVTLALLPLSDDDTMSVLRGLDTGTDHSDLETVAQLSQGSPGRALDLLGSRGAAAFTAFTELAARPALDLAARLQLADRFSARDSAEDFDVFCDLIVDWTAAQARAAALKGRRMKLAQVHDDIAHSIRVANNLNLDRRQTAFDALTAISEALKPA